MDWLNSINSAIEYMEEHLCEDISVEAVASHVYSSYSNFSRIFYLITGVTLTEYIRNRRLSLAGRELLTTDAKVIDVALKYQYDTPESFSKAFSRFHGIAPSEAKRNGGVLEFFYPFSISISVQGGYSMARKIIDEFHWRGENPAATSQMTAEERYQQVMAWSRKARCINPDVFDRLIEWLLDDSEWTPDRLTENRQILMQGVFARFREQNNQLRTHLLELRPSGLVNESVFPALDRFDRELMGMSSDPNLKDTVARVFSDFSIMQDREIRRLIAGDKSGHFGVDHVDVYGFITSLKDADAQVQWTLFMPDSVKRQQRGFKVERFEYIKAPAMRFIGMEGDVDPKKVFAALDELSGYQSGITADILFMHHHGRNVDVEPCHSLWGRFMQPDTPVPEGFQYIDLIPTNDGQFGVPYLSQYAYAVFSGDVQAMHSEAGCDVNAMYDVTRNIILGQGVPITYPHKYWTAEVFLNGYTQPGTAYMFSVDRGES